MDENGEHQDPPELAHAGGQKVVWQQVVLQQVVLQQVVLQQVVL